MKEGVEQTGFGANRGAARKLGPDWLLEMVEFVGRLVG